MALCKPRRLSVEKESYRIGVPALPVVLASASQRNNAFTAKELHSNASLLAMNISFKKAVKVPLHELPFFHLVIGTTLFA